MALSSAVHKLYTKLNVKSLKGLKIYSFFDFPPLESQTRRTWVEGAYIYAKLYIEFHFRDLHAGAAPVSHTPPPVFSSSQLQKLD